MIAKQGHQQILKSRDDHSIVLMDRADSLSEQPFKLSNKATCSWATDRDDIGPEKL